MEDIPAGQFIIEYLGEVIGGNEFKNRSEANRGKNFYFCALGQNMFIDAKIHGNESRFINNSCDPNAVSEKWIVYANGQEQSRIGLFALRKIRMVSHILLNKFKLFTNFQ